MTTPVLSPVRWWRDDATRYQSRPPYRAAQDQDLQFIRPTLLTAEQLKCFDDLAAAHDRYRAELKTWAAGGPPPTLGAPIKPVEFERLEPRQYTPEEAAAVQRDIDAVLARGDFKLPEPVFALCTLAGQSLEDSI